MLCIPARAVVRNRWRFLQVLLALGLNRSASLKRRVKMATIWQSGPQMYPHPQTSDPMLPKEQSVLPSPLPGKRGAQPAASACRPIPWSRSESRVCDDNRHLDELVQDYLLAVSICCFVAQPYGHCQFASRNQLDPSPHLYLPK